MRRTLSLTVLVVLAFGNGPALSAQDVGTSTDPATRIAVVVGIGGSPLLQPDDEPVEDQEARLGELADSLEGFAALATDTPLALAIGPLFLEELAGIGQADAARAHAALVDLAARSPILATPYAAVRLTDLPRDRIVIDLERAAAAIEDELDVAPVDVLYPPALALDDDAAAALPPGSVLFRADYGQEPRRVDGRLFLPAVFGSEVADTGDLLAEVYASGGEAVLHVFADRVGPSVVGSLAGDDRIEVVDIRRLGAEARDGAVALRAPEPPPDTYVRGLRSASETVDGFSSYVSETNPVLTQMRLKLDWARSTAVWSDGDWAQALSYAALVRQRLAGEADLIRPEEGSVTLTSRSGDVPVTVRNLAGYPVRIVVEVGSTKLDFPEGRTQEVTVPPRGQTVTFVAEARTTGSFPMTVSVASPNGQVRFGAAEVTVRSTGAGVSALVLTVGAALFLVVWTIRRALHRRRTT